MSTSKSSSRNTLPDDFRLKFLNAEQLRKIDDLLDQLGEYGELHLIIQRGELRYINKVESFKAWKTGEDSL